MELKKNVSTILSWIFVALALATAVLIGYVEEFNLYFLILLIINMVLAILFANRFSKQIIMVSRILAGLLFVFSGTVKGIDPIGTKYIVEDYFLAYGMDWAMPYAMAVGVFLNAFEFVVGGILLIFSVRINLVSWLVLLMMLCFTATTLYDALYNPVPDCGCFGKALVISNWQTFYKNLVINVFVLIVFITRFKLRPPFPVVVKWSILVVAIAVFGYFQLYNYKHLPIKDFAAWKVGTRLAPENPQPVKYYLTYKNKSTGEQKEYLSPNFPYNDSVWKANWEFVSQRVDDPNKMEEQNVAIMDFAGVDVTNEFIMNPDYQFIVVAYSLEDANKEAFKKVNEFYKRCAADGYSFIIVTSSLPETALTFSEYFKVVAPIYNADNTALKAVIRSNPGLVLLKNGMVVAKWHYNDFPLYDEFKKEYVTK